MTYIKGSWAHHQPSSEPEGHPNRTCLYCCEPWPCDPAKMKADLIAAVVDRVMGDGIEPRCCDEHAASFATREDIVDEIKEL